MQNKNLLVPFWGKPIISVITSLGCQVFYWYPFNDTLGHVKYVLAALMSIKTISDLARGLILARRRVRLGWQVWEMQQYLSRSLSPILIRYRSIKTFVLVCISDAGENILAEWMRKTRYFFTLLKSRSFIPTLHWRIYDIYYFWSFFISS